MSWANDHRPVNERFAQPYHLAFEGRTFEFTQDIETLTTVYDAVHLTQSILLGTYLAQQDRHTAYTKSYLELGAGTGLPSILLANIGARYVLATDIGPVLGPLAASVSRNCDKNCHIEVRLIYRSRSTSGEVIFTL